jgi:transposase
MRGIEERQESMFSYVSPEQRIPKNHPLRPMKQIVDLVLSDLSGAFAGMYARTGRPSIPPEQLLRALLLQALYTIRSERMLMEQLDYNLLFRWFVGLQMDDPIWDATVFTKNRDRLLAGDVAELFFQDIVDRARRGGLMSNEHFTVDGTLIEAWAGQKSFEPKRRSRRKKVRKNNANRPKGPRNPEVNFHGRRRRNETHESRTDPEARMYRKNGRTEARLGYLGHVLMDNRHGLVVDTRVTPAGSRSEREAALEMVATRSGSRRLTLAADKGYDTRAFVRTLRDQNITPHVARKKRYSAIDDRTTRHDGYALSQRKRKCVEEIFGWMKTVGMMRKTRHRGRDRVGWMFTFTAAAYNLVRIRNLMAVPA